MEADTPTNDTEASISGTGQIWRWPRIVSRFAVLLLLYTLLCVVVWVIQALSAEFVLFYAHDDLDGVTAATWLHRAFPAPDTSSQPTGWEQQLSSNNGPITRTVQIEANSTLITTTLLLQLSGHNALISSLSGGDIRRDLSQFLQDAFGNIRILRQPIDVEDDQTPLYWETDSSGQARVWVRLIKPVEAAAMVIDREPDSWVPTHDEFSLRLDDLNISYIYPSPDTATTTDFAIHQSAPAQIPSVSFYAVADASDSPSAPLSVVTPATLVARSKSLQLLGKAPDWPLLAALAYSIAEILPLLIYWRRGTRHMAKLPAFTGELTFAVGSLLLFHFTIYSLAGFMDLAGNLNDVILRFVNGRFASSSYRVVEELTAVMLGVILPSVLLQRAGIKRTRAVFIGILFLRTAALLGFLLIVANTVLTAQDLDLDAYPAGAALLAAGCALLFLVWSLFSLLYRLLSRRRSPPGIALLATVSVVLLCWVDLRFLVPDAWQEVGARLPALVPSGAMVAAMLSSSTWIRLGEFLLRLVPLLVGTALLVSFASVVVRLANAASPIGKTPGSIILVGLLLALILASPTVLVNGQIRYQAEWVHAINLAFILDNLIVCIWLGGLAWMLYRERRTDPQIDPFVRWAAVLAASAVFYGTRAWLFLPISFLIGWPILSYFVRADAWRELGSIYDYVVNQRAKLLDQIIDLQDAENAFKRLRKERKDQYSKGEMTFAAYHQTIEEHRQELEQMEEAAKVDGRVAKDIALTFGPYPSAWSNAVYGAMWSALFALPWIILFGYNYLAEPVSRISYPLWDFASDVLFALTKWILIGFFFGYFFPYMRGNSGLGKGFGFFVVLVLPTIPLMVLTNQTAGAWQVDLFLMLQVFIQCMLLGLFAFDYKVLRQSKQRAGWQMAFDIHGLDAVGLSLSSIIVAVGATVTTIMTATATGVVGQLLQYAIPKSPPFLENLIK